MQYVPTLSRLQKISYRSSLEKYKSYVQNDDIPLSLNFIFMTR